RIVYKRIETSQLWVVDNLHYGTAAHIEVFRESDKAHIGISSISKVEINPKQKINGRTLRLD
ncbi:MAG TPA: hypothetical protein VGF79_10670, partial [Bacteroidia bacterium]